MKAAFAILFSFVLALTQSISVVSAEVQPPSCAHCACGNDCCVGKSSSAPQSPPTAPARSGNTSQSLWLIAYTAQSFSLPPASEVEFSSASLPTSMLNAIPLYHRNCAYLI